MNWSDNRNLEPWEIPDRSLEPNENAPDQSAGAQWTRSLQKRTGRHPHRAAPKANPRRDAFQRSLRAASSLTNAAAVTYGVLGGLQFLLAAVLTLADAVGELPPEIFSFYGAESAALTSGLIALIALMSLFWLLLALGLWRKSRAAAVIGLVWSVLLFVSSVLGLWGETPQVFVILVILAILGVIGAFRYRKLRRLVVAGEPLADRKPHEWVPQSAIGKVGAVALCLGLAGSLALAAAGAPQLGGVASLLPETELASRLQDLGEGLGELSVPDYDAEPPQEDTPPDSTSPDVNLDPASWIDTPLPGTPLSIPMPSVLTIEEEEDYTSIYYGGDNYDLGFSVFWFELPQGGSYTEEETSLMLESMLEGYGSYEGEAIASPPSEGKTDDGIFYRRISVACEDGYVYAVQSFLYDGIAGYVSYERYDLDEWSSSFEGAAKRLFDGIRVSEAGLLI